MAAINLFMRVSLFFQSWLGLFVYGHCVLGAGLSFLDADGDLFGKDMECSLLYFCFDQV